MTTKGNQPYMLSFKYLPFENQAVNDVVIPLEVLAQSDSYEEFWTDGTEVIIEQDAEVTKISTSAHLVLVFESSDLNVSKLVQTVYARAYEISQQHNCPHLLRTWNYLHDINGVDEGLERYQSFCVARHEILAQLGQLTVPNPAATAIGSINGKNSFVFLFSREPGQVIENKRQVSAWQYPAKYAPKQPRFSRAMLLENMLMCSGTASVVGHETMHLGDLEGQFVECLNNVEQLLQSSEQPHAVSSGIYRFYLRDRSCASQLETLIKNQGIENYIVLHGDICRENLLLECEVVFQS